MAEEEEDIRVVLCIRMEDAGLDSIAPGSTIKICSVCDRKVWVAQSTTNMVENNPQYVYEITCTPCGVARMEQYQEENPSEDLKFEQVPGQSNEFIKYIQQFIKAEFN